MDRTLITGGLSPLSDGKWTAGIKPYLNFVTVLTAVVKVGSTGITNQ